MRGDTRSELNRVTTFCDFFSCLPIWLSGRKNESVKQPNLDVSPSSAAGRCERRVFQFANPIFAR
jgi:hypothetical protein